MGAYARSEVLRTFRNTRFLVFSLVFPLVLFVIIAGPNRHEDILGVPIPLYFMGGMTAFGSMMAVVSSGGRIAAERQIGWNRQLRLTPLRPGTYLATKVLCGYLLAGLTIVLVGAVGIALGVRLSVGEWAATIGLVLVGLAPFAAFGVAAGHLVSVDSLGPLMGGVTSILALLGGAWGPIASRGALLTVSKATPSYWLTAASRTGLRGAGWPLQGWLVVAVWTVAMTALATWAYRRDTGRI
ncbi:MAG: ABC transporter permease [Acidimicrobiales bacterium]|nr:ABC transporter permease [Acidimicrobiales bacterium]